MTLWKTRTKHTPNFDIGIVSIKMELSWKCCQVLQNRQGNTRIDDSFKNVKCLSNQDRTTLSTRSHRV